MTKQGRSDSFFIPNLLLILIENYEASGEIPRHHPSLYIMLPTASIKEKTLTKTFFFFLPSLGYLSTPLQYFILLKITIHITIVCDTINYKILTYDSNQLTAHVILKAYYV